MEEIELEPSHHQQSAIIEEYDVQINAAPEDGGHLPGIDEGAEEEGIGDELPGVGIDVECAEEGAHVGKGGDVSTSAPVEAVYDAHQFLALDGAGNVHEGSYDIFEVLAVGHVLVDVETPAHGAAGEIVYDVLSHELHQFHVGSAAVAHDRDDDVDEEEHEDA